LSSGWNMISYLRLESAAVDVVLESITQTGNLEILKDYQGNVYLPEFSFNGIGLLSPGQGYQLKVIESDVIEYLSNEASYRAPFSEVTNNKSIHFENPTPTDHNMTVVLEDAVWDVLPTEESEIAAFDAFGNLVGSAKYTSPTTVITIWGDDETTDSKLGMRTDEELTFRIWSDGLTSSFEVNKWNRGSSNYQVNSINIASSISIHTDFGLETTKRELVRVINVLGQEVRFEDQSFKGEVLFNVYNDGSVEKRVN
jgi:hypothetical protein